jgi:sulfatase maturation enzyme AslB (radical SAM superfamily)
MITFLTIQEAYSAKIERQRKLKGLKYQCHGRCAYIGNDVSPGCYGCFYSDALVYGFRLGDDFGLPNVCNRNCIYCFEPHEVSQSSPVLGPGALNDKWKESLMRHAAEKRLRITTECKMQYYAFAGPSEPLLYLPVLEAQMRFLREVVDPFMGNERMGQSLYKRDPSELRKYFETEEYGI